MAGLVGYASSDEEDEIEQPKPASASNKESQNEALSTDKVSLPDNGDQIGPKRPEVTLEKAKPSPALPVHQSAIPLGPSLPTMDESYPTEREPEPGQEPGSPYSSNRALIHNLTLPSVPVMDIPPSPPGSPPPGTNRKFQQFLDLKKKGIHFNSKLESSTALRNPGLMDKLMGFAEIDDGRQYETTLPRELWDPSAFPEWAFRTKLRESRDGLAKEKEAERTGSGRTAVDFVSSTTPAGGSTTTPGGITKMGAKRKSGWK